MKAKVWSPELQDAMRERLRYNPDTGEFRWRKGKRAGKIAGSLNRPTGYWAINIRLAGEYHSVRAHRVAFLLMGHTPPPQVDHINRQRVDNRWKNLRAATPQLNARNQGTRKSKAGFRGVESMAGKFRARIHICTEGSSIGRRQIILRLGTYDTAEEAHEVHKAAYRAWHLHEPITEEEQVI